MKFSTLYSPPLASFKSFTLSFVFCLFVFLVCLFGLELGCCFLRGVVCLLQFEYDVPRCWFLVCFDIYPVWYFLTFLGLWFSFYHSNDSLFGNFLATVTSDISSACFLLLLQLFFFHISSLISSSLDDRIEHSRTENSGFLNEITS